MSKPTLGNRLRELAHDLTIIVADLPAALGYVATLQEASACIEATGDICWHCHALIFAERPHCDQCPSECDVLGCTEPGCQTEVSG